MERIGELAAFAAAISWTAGALFFERGIKHIGVLSVNFFKVVVGFVLLTITAAIMRGMPLPLDVPLRALIFLSLSGIIGFLVTDMLLFTAWYCRPQNSHAFYGAFSSHNSRYCLFVSW